MTVRRDLQALEEAGKVSRFHGGATASVDPDTENKSRVSVCRQVIARYAASLVGDGETIVFVQDLLVHPAYRRKGVGSALVRTVLERYASVRQIELVTDNTPDTVAFYRSMGFKSLNEIGCRGFMRC